MNDRTNRRLSRPDRDLVWVGTTTPAELFNHPLRELVDEHQEAKHGLLMAEVIGRLAPSLPLAVAAVLALATGQAAVDVLLSGRWVLVRTALRAGAEVRSIARAMGLDADEVETGARFWADQQHEHGLFTVEQRDEVYALLDAGGGDAADGPDGGDAA